MHCIDHFPCTLLQVATVLNIIFFTCNAESHVHVDFLDLVIAQVRCGTTRLPASVLLRAAGGIFMWSPYMYIVITLIYIVAMAQEKAE